MDLFYFFFFACGLPGLSTHPANTWCKPITSLHGHKLIVFLRFSLSLCVAPVAWTLFACCCRVAVFVPPTTTPSSSIICTPTHKSVKTLICTLTHKSAPVKQNRQHSTVTAAARRQTSPQKLEQRIVNKWNGQSLTTNEN